MSKHRFRLLQIEMIRRGVALRHARRAALELECHHRELAEQAIARGETAEQAQRSADDALGSDAMLLERFAHQQELRSRVHRWRAGYVLAPLLGFAAVFCATILALMAISSLLPALHHTRIPAPFTHGMDWLANVLLLWLTPMAVAIGFGVLAGRQHIAFRWLSAGVVVLCLVAAQMNLRVLVTGGTPVGVITAGIGFSTGNLAHELLRVLAMVAVALIPAGWLRYRMLPRAAFE